MSEKTCKELIKERLTGRIDELSHLWAEYQDGGDSIYEFGLSFDYVPAEGRKRGYFRWQLSYGGPADEFRIYAEGRDSIWRTCKIEYLYMDWFDGAKRTLSGENYNLIENIFQSLFVEIDAAEAEFEKAYSE